MHVPREHRARLDSAPRFGTLELLLSVRGRRTRSGSGATDFARPRSVRLYRVGFVTHQSASHLYRHPTRDGVEVLQRRHLRAEGSTPNLTRGVARALRHRTTNAVERCGLPSPSRDGSRSELALARPPSWRERSNDARGACSCAALSPTSSRFQRSQRMHRRTRARRYRSDRRLDFRLVSAPTSHARSATRASPSALSGAPRVARRVRDSSTRSEVAEDRRSRGW